MRRSGTRRSTLRLVCVSLSFLLLAGTLSACGSLGYLAHLGAGQLGVLLDRERITAERLASLTEQEQHGVALTRRALEFGASLGLAATTSYRHLIDRAPEDALRLVVAAPADRLEPLTWWFPITGRVAYRGYFDEARALRFAGGLAEQGYDTYVRPALLYSTLGYFDDPVPRSLLSWPEWAIVDTVLHELVHETVFVGGDVAYNEALATVVAHHATQAFFADQPEQANAASGGSHDDRLFAELLQGLREDLEALYEEVEGPEQARERRAAVFARYQQERHPATAWRTSRYARFPELELSNAYLVAQQTYLGDLPCLEAELAELGDLTRFIAGHVERPGRRVESCEAVAEADTR